MYIIRIENDSINDTILNKDLNKNSEELLASENNIVIYENQLYIKKKLLFSINLIKSNVIIIKKNLRSFILHKNCVLLNKFLSISIHLTIMIVFEIYFFFNFVVKIENKTFIEKINDTFNNLSPPELNVFERYFLKHVIMYDNNYLIHNLYKQYINSKKQQKLILHNLLVKSCKISIIFIVISFILTIISLFHYKKIQWKTIIIENIIMFLFLGLFEYFFFVNIILQYEPVTNEEIDYLLLSNFIQFIFRNESISTITP